MRRKEHLRAMIEVLTDIINDDARRDELVCACAARLEASVSFRGLNNIFNNPEAFAQRLSILRALKAVVDAVQ